MRAGPRRGLRAVAGIRAIRRLRCGGLRVDRELVELLDPCLDFDENSPGKAAARLRDQAARLGRRLVDQIESGGFGHDRLGKCVRNLFECPELGLEGTEISLRA
jgi:hypothetical protein